MKNYIANNGRREVGWAPLPLIQLVHFALLQVHTIHPLTISAVAQ